MNRQNLKYCPVCGSGNLEEKEVEGSRRQVCGECGTVHYRNPLPSVVAIAVRDGKVLLVKRGVEPAIGYWCLPGGFIEVGETVEEGVVREVKEETGIEATPLEVVGVCTDLGGYYGDVLVIGYLTEVTGGEPTAGDDATEVGYFSRDEIPRLAFKCHDKLLFEALRKIG